MSSTSSDCEFEFAAGDEDDEDDAETVARATPRSAKRLSGSECCFSFGMFEWLFFLVYGRVACMLVVESLTRLVLKARAVRVVICSDRSFLQLNQNFMKFHFF